MLLGIIFWPEKALNTVYVYACSKRLLYLTCKQYVHCEKSIFWPGNIPRLNREYSQVKLEIFPVFFSQFKCGFFPV